MMFSEVGIDCRLVLTCWLLIFGRVVTSVFKANFWLHPFILYPSLSPSPFLPPSYLISNLIHFMFHNHHDGVIKIASEWVDNDHHGRSPSSGCISLREGGAMPYAYQHKKWKNVIKTSPPIPSAKSILRRSSRDSCKLGFLFLVILLLLFSVFVVTVAIIFRSTLITFMLTANRWLPKSYR